MHKFHQYREQAHELTTGLCVLLGLAVLGTIVISSFALAGVTVFGGYAYLSATTSIHMPEGYWQQVYLARLRDAGILTTLLVVGTALVKSFQLAEGGGRQVAKSLGGTRVGDLESDPGRQRLRNIVEELAIATGLKPPPAYVLDQEPGINAFAAGYGGKDVVVGVTRGAVDRLGRPQLQGILAHEFSHLLNGDVRLNSRLLGILSGIQAIAFCAQYLIRLATSTSSTAKGQIGSGKHPLGVVLALVFGGVLWPIGQIGAFFALLITSAVNRQREFLADASAVQYTRDPDGLREALIVIREDEIGSRLGGAAAKVASHMFFAAGDRWQRLLETHPPLEERIQRLETSASKASGMQAKLEAVPVGSAGLKIP